MTPEELSAYYESLGPCEEWEGGRDKDGYGWTSSHHRAHRIAWAEANGPIPPGLQVLHRCDNPPCVRVDHLELGTAKDNHRDKAEKGRSAHGERAHKHKLTAEQVVEIRERYAAGRVTMTQLGNEYGVSGPSIGYLIRGQSWARVGGPRSFIGKGRNQGGLTQGQVLSIRRAHEDGVSLVQLARDHGVHQKTISKVIHRKTWKNVS